MSESMSPATEGETVTSSGSCGPCLSPNWPARIFLGPLRHSSSPTKAWGTAEDLTQQCTPAQNVYALKPTAQGMLGHPFPAKVESLTCKHASNDGAHTCQEVGEGPAEATRGLSRHLLSQVTGGSAGTCSHWC